VPLPLRERTFAYGGCEAVVRTTCPTLLDWLEEFVAPWFAVRARPAADDAPYVEVEADGARLAALLAAAEPTGRGAHVYTRDDATPPWPLVRAGARELAAEPRGRVALELTGGQGGRRGVRALAAGERPHGRLAALRVVRELASAHALARGALPVHGAALADAAGVTLFVGPKQAGKSSLLLHALAAGGVRYVANDRVFVEVGAQGAAARGMPTIVSLREGSLALAPRLREEVATRAWHYSSTLAEARAQRAGGEAAEGAGERWPPGLSPSQLCVLLGVEARAGGALARIVFPEIAAPGGAARFALRRLAPDEAAARLLAGGLVAGGRPAPFLTGAAPPDRGALAASARALAECVPCLACTLGPDAYAPPPVWDAIRAARSPHSP
jgi:hypothetical protein